MPLLQPSGAIFNPRTLSPVWWLEALYGSANYTVAGGGGQTRILDLSGNNSFGYEYPVPSLTFTQAAQNGFDAMNVASTSYLLGVFGSSDYSAGLSSYSLMFLAKMGTSGTIFNGFEYNSKDDDTNGGIKINYAGTSSFNVEFWASGQAYPGTASSSMSFTATNPTTNYLLYTITFNNSDNQMNIYIGNTLNATATMTPTNDYATGKFGAFYDQEESSYSGGANPSIVSAIRFNSVLTTEQRNNMQLYYYNRKYNLGL